MKLSFSSMSSSGNLLLVTTLVAIALSHSVKALAKTHQELTSITLQAPVQIQGKPQGSQAGCCTNTFQLFSPGDILATNSDNPPPISDSSGGSR